jgi:hypothetical protein
VAEVMPIDLISNGGCWVRVVLFAIPTFWLGLWIGSHSARGRLVR